MLVFHFNLMVKGISQVFGWSSCCKGFFGYRYLQGGLGRRAVSGLESGVIDNLAETEEEAFEMIRQFLSYLPPVGEMPPRIENGDDPERRDESLLSIIPRNKRQAYDAYKILDAVLDRESF